MRRFAFFVGMAVIGFGVSCNCNPPGLGSCSKDSDCKNPNEVCSSTGECIAGHRNADGGITVYGDGGSQFTDAGNRTGADGGPCVGLQCQQASCPMGSPTTITGKVYDPSGQLPLYNVIVYVPNGTVEPFSPGISCEQCGASVSGSPLVITLTDTTGSFTLTNVPVGNNIPVVLQIGKWRRQITVNVPTACMTSSVPASETHMPQDHTQGDIPHIAIDTGQADPFECLLLKMGIGAEIKEPGNGARIDYYQENGIPISNNTPAGSTLYGSTATLDQYDIVLLPCEGAANPKSATDEQNIVDYTNDGGRVFTTHYGYEWIGNGYGAAPFPSTANWCPNNGGNCPVNGPSFNNNVFATINTGFPKGLAFSQWLAGPQVAATTNNIITLVQARWDVGTVDATAPAYVLPTAAWMFGNHTGQWMTGSTYDWTPHLTFNTPWNPPNLPDGDAGTQCGRVVFSDFHVTASDQVGNPQTFPSECVPGQAYTDQEKALVFMLFDLSSCIQSDATAPMVCTGLGGTCMNSSQCCSGLSCLDATGSACTGAAGEAGCTCYSPIQ